MNEELDSQLSAMFDDELPEAECELLAKRLARDEQLKARWGRYAVIGAAIRAERGVRLDTHLAERVSAAISAEPALAAEPAQRKNRFSSFNAGRWMPHLATAAGAVAVALLSIMWLRQQAPMVETAGPAVAANTAVPQSVSTASPDASNFIESEEPDSYTVPAAVEAPSLLPTAELAKYVVAHSEFLTPVSRRNALSALIASEGTAGANGQSEEQFDGGADDVE